MKFLNYLRLIIFISLTVIIACNSGKKTHDPQREDLGEYKGTVPCADCPGSKIEVELKSDNTFEIEMDYIDRESKTKEEGTYVEENGIVTCSGKYGKSYFLVGDKTLTMLDADKKVITGSMASMYVLKMEFEKK